MREGCFGNCVSCGKCGSFAVLDGFAALPRRAEPREGHGIAIDIGTTGVAMALLDLYSGAVLARHGFINPQRAYGPDVISRIAAANGGALEDLRRVISEGIEAGIGALLASCGEPRILGAVIAGNTVMTHLLLGLPCDGLGAAPFRPAHTLDGVYQLFGYNITVVPWLAAFVGGDILAGLLYVPKRDCFLLIDLGTNGEMALFCGGRLTVTSAAAGPAFEGTARGGGAAAVIDDLARLIRGGHIDETGLLRGGAPQLFTQGEIRNLQLAKSAVRSGVELLLDSAGLDYASLDAVYLAGGMGQALNAENAAAAGLLPSKLTDRVQAVGNASLGGAARLLLEPEAAEAEMKALTASAREINLAEHPRFNELFVEHMLFGA